MAGGKGLVPQLNACIPEVFALTRDIGRPCIVETCPSGTIVPPTLSSRSNVFLMRFISRLLIPAFLFSAFAFAQNATSATARTPDAQAPSSDWRAVHNSALIVDTHADTPGRFVDENFDLAQDAGKGYMDFNKIKAGNLGAEFFSIWVEPKAYKGHEAKRALDMIDSVYEQARRHPDKMMMAFSTEDIRRHTASRNWQRCMGVEGGHAIEGDIRILRDYYRLGVRYMTLTWSNS